MAERQPRGGDSSAADGNGPRPLRARRGRLTDLLRPREGRRLPRQLRARRVSALATVLPSGLADPGFRELVSHIDGGGTWHHGNQMELYSDGEPALAAMLSAVAAATREALVEAYIFGDDATGRRMADALVSAASRGVSVKVLADAWGSFRTANSFWRQLVAGGVGVRLFHRFTPSPWWQPFRDHRKILVVDRRTAFTGGMNIANEYAYSRRRRRAATSMRDTHLRLVGPAAEEMAAVFSEGWERAGGTPLTLRVPATAEAPPPGPGGGTSDQRPVTNDRAGGGGSADVLVLESRPGRGHRETAAVLAAIVGAARESVWLTNGYFAPGRLAVAILGRAAHRGLDVRLLLPGRTDVPLVRHAGHGCYSRLLAHGVRVWEYQPSVLHAKTLVADGVVSVVGSTNLDFRSFRFNAECNAVVYDAALAGELRAAFLSDLEESEEVLLPRWRRRGALHRVADRMAGALAPLL